MAAKIISIQLKIPGGVKQPVETGNRWATAVNLAKIIRQGLMGGNLFGLSGSGSYLQVQTDVVAASGTVTPAAVQAADTVTLNGQALTATQKRATGTLTAATAIAGNTCVINGVTFTGVEGEVTPGEATFSVDTGNTETAASLATQINAYSSPLISGIVAARSSSAVCTVYAVNQGTSGNAITLAGTATTLEASGATLENGAAVANNAFDMAGTNVTTGTALAYAINNSTTAAIKLFTATVNSSTGVVTITAKVGGTGGNAYTFVSSNGTRLAVTGSGTLAGGAASAVTRWSI